MELPVSFLENMKKLLSPEEFNAYLDSYSEERVYGLRVNTNKLTPEEFEKIWCHYFDLDRDYGEIKSFLLKEDEKLR